MEENHGVILGRQTSDWVAGTIPHQVRNLNGNWKPFTDPWSVQWTTVNGKRVDYMRCLTEALLNSIETQEFFLTGKRVKYSRRWIAKVSETTEQGNWGYKVADAIRHYGLVLESSYPTTPGLTWVEHYQDIPEPLFSQLKAEGQEWLKTHDCAYEWLIVEDPNLDYHLQHAPLVVIIPGHGICDINSVQELADYLDSYQPFYKQTAVKNLSDAMKFVLTMKESMPTFIHIEGSSEYGLMYQSEFVTTIVRFTSEQDAKEKLKVQTIDYSKAKTIKL